LVKETLKQRAIYVYLPSEEQKDSWQKRSDKAGVSISKFVIEQVENSLRQEEEPDFKSRNELWKENNELKQQVQDMSRQVRLLDTVVDKLEQELRRYRGKPFLEQQFEGVRNYDRKLIEVLRSKEIVADEEIFSHLGIAPSDSEAVRAISKQLENLEACGLVTSSARGWKWTA
jgi:vacuolar-type H+-ATPase subunit I/STV1